MPDARLRLLTGRTSDTWAMSAGGAMRGVVHPIPATNDSDGRMNSAGHGGGIMGSSFHGGCTRGELLAGGARGWRKPRTALERGLEGGGMVCRAADRGRPHLRY